MDLSNQLYTYFKFKASLENTIILFPSFTFSLHSSDEKSMDGNYALPRLSLVGDITQGEIEELCQTFILYKRTPRICYIEEVFPHVSPTLQASGFVEVDRSYIMTCTPETLRSISSIQGLTIVTLSHHSSLQDLKEGLNTNVLGFDDTAELATNQEVEEFGQGLVLSRAFIARLQGQPAAAGMFTDIHKEITEIVGVTTLKHFRYRGIAALLTEHITATAFALGAKLVFLICEDEQTCHVYKHSGFRLYSTLLTYSR